MPKYWMITDRDIESGQGKNRASLTYWVSENGKIDDLKSWHKLDDGEAFRKELLKVADAFPSLTELPSHEDQKHVTLFIHGFNNDWMDAARRYKGLADDLFQGDKGLGTCVLFSWPSDGMSTGYLPDRADARNCAPDLADVLSELYDWLLRKQAEGADDPCKACRAKTSVIAHSMGNYLFQNAMQVVWTRKNQPLLVSLVNQLLMVAADVDNDLFKCGEGSDGSDGDAIANLTYRVTALYSGLDDVLGLSAGMKHFGNRRLGRSGLDRNFPVPDNVWDIDCSSLIPKGTKDVHSVYFKKKEIRDLMEQLLRGLDRKVLAQRKVMPRQG